MKKLTIDGCDVEVPDDCTILEAAEAAGVEIPTLCHDPRLVPYGACRMCLVEVEGQRKLLPACTSPAEDGMVVHTHTDKIQRIRHTVLEFLCVHHPLDCPVCDSAGECDLQNMVFAYGVGENRFQGEKKGYETDSRNPLVERDLNRCILCAKCVRICREVQGVGAIGMVWRGFDTEIAPPFGEPLDCEFCGQCIAVCPVGALTNKLFKYRTRSWLLDKTPSTCPHCSTGCRIDVEARKGRVYRVTSPVREGVNEGNLCPKGRFGYEYVNSDDRLAGPLLRKGSELAPASWDEALDAAAGRLRDIAKAHGPAAVGAVASPRLTNEENYLLAKVFRMGLGTNNIDSIARYGYRSFFDGARRVFGSLRGAADFEDLQRARTILVVGSNVTETNPVVGNLMLKAAFRNGARLVVLAPRGSKLTRHADLWVRNAPGTDAHVLAGLSRLVCEEKLGSGLDAARGLEGFDDFVSSVSGFTPAAVQEKAGVSEAELRALADAVTSEGPLVTVLTLHSAENTKGLQTYLAAAGLAVATGHAGAEGSGLLVPGETCNIQGVLDAGAAPDLLPGGVPLSDEKARAALAVQWGAEPPGEPGLDMEAMLSAAEAGTLKALWVAGENPLLAFPDTERVRRALDKLEFLGVQDLFLTETAERAHVVLAAAGFAERSGTVTNAEQRIHRFRRGLDRPGEAWEDWRILSGLAARLEAGEAYARASEITDELARSAPALAEALAAPEGGLRWTASLPEPPAPRLPSLSLDGTFRTTEEHPLALLTGALLNHAGTVTRHGPGLLAVSPGTRLLVSEEDAADLGLAGGDRATVSSDRASVTAEVEITDRLPKGVVFLPVHFAEGNPNVFTAPPDEHGERAPAAVKVAKA